MRTQKPGWQQKIAAERIEILFDLAEKYFSKKPERSKRYVELARKIGMRYNVRLSKPMKERFCKKCSALMTKNTMELKSGTVKCLNCGHSYRKSEK